MFSFPEDGRRAGFRKGVIYLKNTTDKVKKGEKEKKNGRKKENVIDKVIGRS
jgi:hypothetical protein